MLREGLERDLCLSYTLHTLTFSMRTNSVLTRCKQRAVHCVFNENEHHTHTLLEGVRPNDILEFVLIEEYHPTKYSYYI